LKKWPSLLCVTFTATRDIRSAERAGIPGIFSEWFNVEQELCGKLRNVLDVSTEINTKFM
jgi:hypothetical protein